MGPSFRQSRRHPRGRRLPVAQRPAAHRARRTDGDDQGARDTGRARAGKQLQPGRARSCAPGTRRLDRRGDGAARRQPRPGHQCGVQRLDRRRGAAHLPACAQHRFAKELGCRRCDQPRRAPRAVRAQGRDGLSVGAIREDLGFPGRAVQIQALGAAAGVRQLRDGKRAVQDIVSGRIPRSDRGRSGDDSASANPRQNRTRSIA